MTLATMVLVSIELNYNFGTGSGIKFSVRMLIGDYYSPSGHIHGHLD
jgi:hypothetical protein